VLGSFALGVLVYDSLSRGVVGSNARLVFGTGILSSFSVQTVLLFEEGNCGAAIANAIGNLTLSAGAIGLAWLFVG